ncbi:MAG: hypothetical protein H6645_10850 [Caldilineaceae bacterium]|nr:hypothetical protein [Caldilineaceae bacterium]
MCWTQRGSATTTMLVLAAALFIVFNLLQRWPAALNHIGEDVSWTATNALRRPDPPLPAAGHGFHNTHTPGEFIARRW